MNHESRNMAQSLAMFEAIANENRRLRAVLEEIATDRVWQPGCYDDLLKGGGIEVPSRAAEIAIKALGGQAK